MKRGERSGRTHLKNCASAEGPAIDGGAIKISVTSLDHGRIGLLALHSAGEAMQRGECAIGLDLKERPKVESTAEAGRAIEVAIGSLQQLAVGCTPIATSELMLDRESPGGRDPKDRSVNVDSTESDAVEIAVISESQTGLRAGPISAAEAVQDSILTR